MTTDHGVESVVFDGSDGTFVCRCGFSCTTGLSDMAGPMVRHLREHNGTRTTLRAVPDRDLGGTPGWRERLARYAGDDFTSEFACDLRAALAATAKREGPMPGEVRERVDTQAWNAFHAAAGGARITAAIHAGADEAWRAALAASSPQEDETATETGEWEVALICCGRDNGTQETGRRRVGSWRSPCHTGPKPDDAGLTPNEAVVLIYGTDGDPFERYAADALAALAPLLGSPGADEGQQR